MLILMLRSLGHLFNKEPRGPVFKQQWWPFVQRQGHKVNIRYGEAGAFIVLWISYHHLLRAWRLYGAFSFVSLKLPSQQTAALTTVVSTIHLNLAGRIWQSDAKQAARKQPKDEYTSILPNLCTGIFVGCNEAVVWRCLLSPCFLSCLRTMLIFGLTSGIHTSSPTRCFWWWHDQAIAVHMAGPPTHSRTG